MAEDEERTTSRAAEASVLRGPSQWTVDARRNGGRTVPPAAHLPRCPSGRDAYPFMQPGTISTATADQLAEAARVDAPDSRPSPTPRRRKEPRYDAVLDRVWLQWWADGEFNGLSVRIVNVSRNGALIVAGARLREHQPLRVSMEDPESDLGVDAVVLGTVEAWGGMHNVRLGFLSPCPDAFLIAMANGFEAWLSGKRASG